MRFAGSRIVVGLLTAAACPLAGQRMLRGTPELRLDAAEHGFSFISAIATSPGTNTIAVFQGDRDRVAFFSFRGVPLGTFPPPATAGRDRVPLGGMGGWNGDTLWVVGDSTRYYRTLPPTGNAASSGLLAVADSARRFWAPPPLARSVEPLPRHLRSPDGRARDTAPRWTYPVARTADGGFVLLVVYAVGAHPHPAWLPIDPQQATAAVRVDREGRLIRVLATISRREMQLCNPTSPRGGVYPIPFCVSPALIVSRDGATLLRTVPLPQGRLRILTIDGATGDTLRRLDLARDTDPIPEHVVDTMRRRIRAVRIANRDEERFRNALPWPTHYPSYGDVKLGDDGSVWVERFPRGGTLHAWFVYTAEGREFGIFPVVGLTRIVSASLEHVWLAGSRNGGREDAVRMRVGPQ